MDLPTRCVATQVTHQHCLDLISAFKQDAVKSRYDDWDDLIDYCNRSAAPVGRYLVDLHHESSSTYPASDALCNALQVINHLQDCGDDYRNLNRVYIPQDWMTAANVDVSALADRQATEALRGVLDRCQIRPINCSCSRMTFRLNSVTSGSQWRPQPSSPSQES